MARPSMAPGRKKQAKSETVFTLGLQGRKTGVLLPDSGVRDENGIEPLDGIFDSPTRDDDTSEEEDEASEVDMDIENTPGPDPHSLLKKQQSPRRPMPRGRLLPKTNLGSSPLRPSTNGAVNGTAQSQQQQAKSGTNRRLDFGTLQPHALPRPAPSSAGHATMFVGATEDSEEEEEEQEEEEEEEEEGEEEEDEEVGEIADFIEESMQMLEAGADDEPDITPEADSDDEEDEEPEPAQPKRRGRPPKAKGLANGKSASQPAASVPNSPPKRRRGGHRSTGESGAAEEEEAEEENGQPPASKRQRIDGPSATRPKARGRKPAPVPAASSPRIAPPEVTKGESSKQQEQKKPKGKRGRPPAKAAAEEPVVGEADASVVIMPRPALPKRSGLVINRRKEVPGESSAIFRTRSGRSSFKPLAYWKGERVEHDQSEGVFEDALSRDKNRKKLWLPSIKEVCRVEDEEPPPTSRRPGHRGRKLAGGRRRQDDDDEDDEPDRWEVEAGEITAHVVTWEPEHDVYPPGPDDEVRVDEEVIAMAASAIKTREVLGASFRFTKTLSTPFFGTGVVELAPGAEKKAKNSRKMHMAFIVHTGRVTVTVNDTTFSIGKGGMWFVPRSNYYSVVNESNRPSKIFFAQGCEVIREPIDEAEDEDGS